jgi:SUMO-like protein
VISTPHLNPGLMDRTMGALIVGARVAKRECAVLLDPELAQTYLTFMNKGRLKNMTALNLAIVDWSRSRRADFTEVPSDTTMGELVTEVKEAMQLARDTPFHIIYGGTKLQRDLTLDEVGVEDGEEITIAPEVSAG